MVQDILQTVRKEFDGAFVHLGEELKKLRTGRAHSSMLDGPMVTAYGTPTPLVGLATVTAPEAQLIQISPFDPSNLQAISTTIRDDQTLGLNPVDDGRVIRLQIPALTTERRQLIVKQLGEKTEDCYIRMRNARHEALRQAKKAKDDKLMSDDDEHRLEKQIDDLMLDMKKKVEALAASKEAEVMAV